MFVVTVSAPYTEAQNKIKMMNILITLKPPNDPKLSHGAKNRKRGFAANLQMKEQPPLAPARC
jgi:hypothetical protein